MTINFLVLQVNIVVPNALPMKTRNINTEGCLVMWCRVLMVWSPHCGGRRGGEVPSGAGEGGVWSG